MRKVRKMQLIALILIVFFMFGSVTYAWMSQTISTNPILIDTASLNVSAKLYSAGQSQDEVADDSYTLIDKSLEFGIVLPGEVYRFKLEVENKGTIDGVLTVSFEDLIPSSLLPKGAFLIQYKDATDQDVVEAIDYLNGNVISQHIEILPGSKKTVYFQIIVSGMVTEQTQGEWLIIERIVIRLDQKR